MSGRSRSSVRRSLYSQRFCQNLLPRLTAIHQQRNHEAEHGQGHAYLASRKEKKPTAIAVLSTRNSSTAARRDRSPCCGPLWQHGTPQGRASCASFLAWPFLSSLFMLPLNSHPRMDFRSVAAQNSHGSIISTSGPADRHRAARDGPNYPTAGPANPIVTPRRQQSQHPSPFARVVCPKSLCRNRLV